MEDKWINARIQQPEFKEDETYSENVLAVVEGCDEIQVMCYCYMTDGNNEHFYVWCNCYGDIHGDGYFDDNYEVLLWQPLPKMPIISQTKTQ